MPSVIGCLNRRRPSRRGFSLVELLVVIAIIGALVGLLLPAVQASRESARRSQCTNNLKQIVLAHHSFEGAKKHLPLGDRATLSNAKKVGPGVQILPYVEEAALHERYNWNVNWYDPENAEIVRTPLSVYVCPSTPNSDRLFSGTEGGVPYTATASDYIAPSGVGTNEKDYVRINHGLEVTDDKAILTKKVKLPNRLRHVTDGLANTIMYLECAAKPEVWSAGQRTTGSNLKTGWASHATGFDPKFYGPAGCASAGSCSINCCNDQGIYAFHPGGSNAGLGDGSVRFLNESLSPVLFVSMITRANGEVVEWEN